MNARALMYLISVAVYLLLAGLGVYTIVRNPHLQNPFSDEMWPLAVWGVTLAALLMALWRGWIAWSSWKPSQPPVRRIHDQ